MKVLHYSTKTLLVLVLVAVVLLETVMVQPAVAWYDTPSGYSINSPTSTTYESRGGSPDDGSTSSSSSSSDTSGSTRYSILQQLMALKKKLTSLDSSQQQDDFVFPGQQRSESEYSQQQQYQQYDYGSSGFFPLNVAGIASIAESRDQTNEFLSNMQASYRPYRTGQNEIRSAPETGYYGTEGFYPIPAEQQQQDQGFHFPGQQQDQYQYQQQQQQQQEGFRFPGQGTTGISSDLNMNQGNEDDTALFLDGMKRSYEPYASREGNQVSLSSSDWNQLSSTGFFFPSYANNAQLQQSNVISSEEDQTGTFTNIMKQNYMPYSMGLNEIPSPTSAVGTEFHFPGQQQQQQAEFRFPGGFSQTGLVSQQDSSSEGDETNQFLNVMRNSYSAYSTGANVQQAPDFGTLGFFPAGNQQEQQSFRFPGQ